MFKGNMISPLQLLPLPAHIQHNIILFALDAVLMGWIGHGQLQIDHIPVQMLEGAQQLQSLACVQYSEYYHSFN